MKFLREKNLFSKLYRMATHFILTGNRLVNAKADSFRLSGCVILSILSNHTVNTDCTILFSWNKNGLLHEKDNLTHAICKQQRHRSACTSVQSDQHLCCLLLRIIV